MWVQLKTDEERKPSIEVFGDGICTHEFTSVSQALRRTALLEA